MRASHPCQRSAFSLVELSIVLVILGLLTGGILAGQSLIRASELRSVSTDFGKYTTAIGAFRDKYMGIPGDITNTNNFANMTEQGNGDGLVTASTSAGANEVYFFWENLAGAGMIEGTYSSAAFSTSSSSAGTTNPRAKLANTAWNIGGIGSVATDGASKTMATAISYTNMFAANYGNAFTMGGGTNAYAPSGVLKPEEAWNIDTKLDDGRPNQGAVLSLYSQHTAAATSGQCSFTSSSVITYQLSDTSGSACSFIMKTGY